MSDGPENNNGITLDSDMLARMVAERKAARTTGLDVDALISGEGPPAAGGAVLEPLADAAIGAPLVGEGFAPEQGDMALELAKSVLAGAGIEAAPGEAAAPVSSAVMAETPPAPEAAFEAAPPAAAEGDFETDAIQAALDYSEQQQYYAETAYAPAYAPPVEGPAEYAPAEQAPEGYAPVEQAPAPEAILPQEGPLAYPVQPAQPPEADPAGAPYVAGYEDAYGPSSFTLPGDDGPIYYGEPPQAAAWPSDGGFAAGQPPAEAAYDDAYAAMPEAGAPYADMELAIESVVDYPPEYGPLPAENTLEQPLYPGGEALYDQPAYPAGVPYTEDLQPADGYAADLAAYGDLSSQAGVPPMVYDLPLPVYEAPAGSLIYEPAEAAPEAQAAYYAPPEQAYVPVAPVDALPPANYGVDAPLPPAEAAAAIPAEAAPEAPAAFEAEPPVILPESVLPEPPPPAVQTMDPSALSWAPPRREPGALSVTAILNELHEMRDKNAAPAAPAPTAEPLAPALEAPAPPVDAPLPTVEAAPPAAYEMPAAVAEAPVAEEPLPTAEALATPEIFELLMADETLPPEPTQRPVPADMTAAELPAEAYPETADAPTGTEAYGPAAGLPAEAEMPLPDAAAWMPEAPAAEAPRAWEAAPAPDSLPAADTVDAPGEDAPSLPPVVMAEAPPAPEAASEAAESAVAEPAAEAPAASPYADVAEPAWEPGPADPAPDLPAEVDGLPPAGEDLPAEPPLVTEPPEATSAVAIAAADEEAFGAAPTYASPPTADLYVPHPVMDAPIVYPTLPVEEPAPPPAAPSRVTNLDYDPAGLFMDDYMFDSAFFDYTAKPPAPPAPQLPAELPPRQDMPKKRRGRLARFFFKTLGVLFVMVLSAAGLAFGAITVICTGPFPAAKQLFVVSVTETSAVKFLANIYFSPQQVADILEANALIAPDEVTDPTTPFDPPAPEAAAKDLEVVDISGSTYKGKMMIVQDPSRVRLATIPAFGEEVSGRRVEQLVADNGAVAGINAGGFADAGGVGKGGQPLGLLIRDGKILSGTAATYGNIIGISNENRLIVGAMTGRQALELGVRDAVHFEPTLIVNGKPAEVGGTGSGLNPRTCIGQRADGAMLLLVIDGRQPHSVGATMEDCLQIMQDFEAVNAANLDGGSSSVMVHEGEIINVCASLYGSRTQPAAFVVM